MPRRLLLALAALLAAAAGAWLATRPAPPGDEALIIALLEDGARAAEARQASQAVEGVSEAFQGNGGIGKRELKQLVAAAALRGAWVAVKVTGVRVAVDGDDATANLGLVASRGGQGAGVGDLLPERGAAFRVEARLRREDGGWRVVRATWRQVSFAEALAEEEAPR